MKFSILMHIYLLHRADRYNLEFLKIQVITITVTDQKTQKLLKGDFTQHHVDIQAM